MKHAIFIAGLLIAASVTDTFGQQIVPGYITTGDEDDKSLADDLEGDRIFIFGAGSTDALELDKLTASGGLNIGVKLSKSVTAFLAYNFGGNVPKNERSDSVFLSSFFFPDIATTAFASSVNFMYYKSKDDAMPFQAIICAEGSAQKRIIDLDSVRLNFGVTNFNIGPKFTWTYSNKVKKNTAVFTLAGFYNSVYFNDNANVDFTTFSKSPSTSRKIPRILEGFSFLVSAQLNNAIVYFRTYSDIKTGQDLAFTVGLKAVGQFFSF